jgi:hypothetical protein
VHDLDPIAMFCFPMPFAWQMRNLVKRYHKALLGTNHISIHAPHSILKQLLCNLEGRTKSILDKLHPLLKLLPETNKKYEFLTQVGCSLLQSTRTAPLIRLWIEIASCSDTKPWTQFDIWRICQGFMTTLLLERQYSNWIFVTPFLTSLPMAWQRAQVLQTFFTLFSDNQEEEFISTLCFLVQQAPNETVFKRWISFFQMSWIPRLTHFQQTWAGTRSIYVRWFVRCLILDETNAQEIWNMFLQMYTVKQTIRKLNQLESKKQKVVKTGRTFLT